MMKLGASKHWSVALKLLTNETDIRANAFLEYFEPLREYLTREIKRMKSDEMRDILTEYNKKAATQCNKLKLAKWAKITDINNVEKHGASVKAVAEHAAFIRDEYERHFHDLDPSDYDDEQVRRQVRFIKMIGKNALNSSRLNELTRTLDEMENVYNNAEFCDFNKPNCTQKLTLEPGEFRGGVKTHFPKLKFVHFHRNEGNHGKLHGL